MLRANAVNAVLAMSLAALGCGAQGETLSGFGGDAGRDPGAAQDAGVPRQEPDDPLGIDPGDGRGCIPRTCEQMDAECGPIADGCGGVVQCGECDAPLTCGGGGEPSRCGSGCVPTTCEAEGKNCGFLADGCGDVIDCGGCTGAGQVCGAGGEPNVCFAQEENPDDCPALVTCEDQNATCGQVGNGCGGLLDCNPADGPACPDGQTCGGGGTPNQCGAPTCTPKTCDEVDPESCGAVPDGCGGLLEDCGVVCEDPESCGGGGVPGRCGAGAQCVPKTAAEVCDGKCGPVSDGCGDTVDCGGCTEGTCGGGGVPSVCGAPPCEPRTCESLNAECGLIDDGCGDTVDCGGCTEGTCGGGGVPFQCGSPTCTPKSCEELGIECGLATDGCDGQQDCGGCPAGQGCGAGGVANECGTPQCEPITCDDVDPETCGPVADGCGGLTDSCGTCPPPSICGGGGVPSRCGGGDEDAGAADCTGLCEHQVDCGAGATVLTGTVLTPSGQIPLYNAVVYVPNAPLPDFSDGPACDRCEDEDLGSPLVSALTGPDGTFELRDVPAGVSFPLVIKMGKWRRVVDIDPVDACTTRALTAEQTRLPRNRTEGHIPKIAISTGQVDALECVLYKAGLDASEFTRPTRDGRIHLYRANGAWPDEEARNCSENCRCVAGCTFSCCSLCCSYTSACADCGGSEDVDARNALRAAVDAQRLYESQAVLDSYDMLAFGCEASEQTRNEAARYRLRDYVDKGGRLFLSHYNYDWITREGRYDTDPLHTTAVWYGPWMGGLSDPTAAIVDDGFPKGVAFVEWLDGVNASHPTLGSGHLLIDEPRAHVRDVTSASRRWIYTTQADHGQDSIQHFTFNTPVPSSEETMCGRVVYTAFHVTTGSHGGSAFPGHCTGPLTAQEKVLLFMFFDLAACVSDDSRPPPPPPTCTPRTCEEAEAECGLVADGCGGSVDCGDCPEGEFCGFGDGPNACGSSCRLRTCGEAGANCGWVSDGCGGSLYCGDCPEGSACGGGGTPNICGNPPCQPLTCELLGATCGPVANGCGGIVECGDCPEGEICGGSGIPNVCGTGECTPLTCESVGAECGVIGDGCGGTVDCGTCPAPLTCGGSGIPNQCGGDPCEPQSCEDAGAACGPIGDGCGGVIQCGDCPEPQICGGGGVASQCGGSCSPTTCEAQNAECGLIGDGCGGVLSCGSCPSGQTCGGDGVANQCGEGSSCTPQTCQEMGAECGKVGDSCGGILDCGDCPSPQSCGGGGVANQCGEGDGGCVKLTCEQQGADCGPVADGCGGLLDCGVCPAGTTCGGGGEASKCGGQIR